MRLFVHMRKSPSEVRQDHEGQEFASLEEAYRTACRAIPGMVAEFMRQRTDPMGFVFEIADAQDILVLEIPFREIVDREPRLGLLEAGRGGLVPHGWEAPDEKMPTSAAGVIASPVPCLLLGSNAAILAASAPYAHGLFLTRQRLAGRNLFDLFPDSADNDGHAGRRRLEASLLLVAETRSPHRFSHQRYDVRDGNGEWTIGYWSVRNAPVFGDDGRFLGIAHIGELLKPPSDEFAHRLLERPPDRRVARSELVSRAFALYGSEPCDPMWRRGS